MTPNKKKYIALQILGWLLCVGVPVTVILFYFPLFIDRGSTETVAATAVVLLLIAAVPCFKYIKRLFKRTPASWLVWAVLFGIFWALETIIHELIVVSAWGAGSNILGGVFFKLSKKYRSLPEKLEDEV